MTVERARKQRTIAMTVLAVVGLGLGIAGYLREAPAQETTRFYLRGDGGDVLFEHARHAEQSGACVVCHHDLAGEALDCQECHDDPDYTPAAADHAELLELHERDCENCHEIAPAAEAASCRECHDDDLVQVYHQSCSDCHLASAPERFADAAGEPRCRNCHLR